MHLLKLRVQNYRLHKDTTIEFEKARNIICGPNESGKSTLIEAAHRALFLRAKTGGKTLEEMKSKTHGGNPEVELTFSAQGTTWTVHKFFGGSTRGYTKLNSPNQPTLLDTEAEQKLAELLQAETASGRSAPSQLQNCWPHLWVWQGSSGIDPAEHATSYQNRLIHRLQQDGLTALIQSPADQAVAQKISEAYYEIHTQTGQVKAGTKLHTARKNHEQALQNLQQAKATTAELEQALHDFHQASQTLKTAEETLPELQKQLAKTEASLARVEALKKEVETRKLAHQTSLNLLQETREADQKITQILHQIQTTEKELLPANNKLHELETAENHAQTKEQNAEKNLQHTQQARHKARNLHEIATTIHTLLAKRKEHTHLKALAEKNQNLTLELTTLKNQLAQLPLITPQNVKHLQKLTQQKALTKATLDAIATYIKLITTEETVTIDGENLTPGTTKTLTNLAKLEIGPHTRIEIRPGGGNTLAETQAIHTKATQALHTELTKLTVENLEAATTIAEQRKALETKIQHQQSLLENLGAENAPSNLTEIAREITQLETRVNRLNPEIHQTPTSIKEASAQLIAAETSELNAQKTLTSARQQLKTARENREAHSRKLSTSKAELQNLQTSIKVLEEIHGKPETRKTRISQHLQSVSETETALQTVTKEITALHPEVLQTDRTRFQQAIAQQESQTRQAADTLLISRERLTLSGQRDPQQELTLAKAQLDTTKEILETEEQHRSAIEKLHNLFLKSKEKIDQSLVAPLARKIDTYLSCVFGPQTKTHITSSEGSIQHITFSSPDRSPFDFHTLSGGAKEQVATAARLAFAEILAADHHGTLPIIFDDAFTYSDPQRLQALQQMLYLASTRGLQIILLTMHPQNYQTLPAQQTTL